MDNKQLKKAIGKFIAGKLESPGEGGVTDKHTYDGHGGHSPECFPCKVVALKATYILRWLRTRDEVAKEAYKQIVDDLKKLCEEAE